MTVSFPFSPAIDSAPSAANGTEYVGDAEFTYTSRFAPFRRSRIASLFGVPWMFVIVVTVTALFLRMIDSFQVFGQIFLLTGGGPGTATTSTTLFGFFQGFQNFDLGYGATIALALLLIVVLFSTVFLRVSRRLLQRVEG